MGQPVLPPCVLSVPGVGAHDGGVPHDHRQRDAPRIPDRAPPPPVAVESRIVGLQRTAGNRAVTGLLAVQRQDPPGGDRPLDAAQVSRALRFYTLQPKTYTPEIISQMQGAVGAPETGTADEETVQAVARWQRDNGAKEPNLKVDGMAGPRTLPRMFTSGLNAPGKGKAFGEQAQDQVVRRWHNLTPAGRGLELGRLANEHLAAAGVPAMSFKTESKSAVSGAFDFRVWQMSVGLEALRKAQPTRDEAAKLVDTVYHEARHAEQWFRMAQMRAGRGLSAAAIAAEMTIPPRIAELAVAAPLVRGSMQAVIAEGWFDSAYGAGREHRNAALTRAEADEEAFLAAQARFDKDKTPANEAALKAAKAKRDKSRAVYQDLPEENDAFATGAMTGAGVTRGAPDPVTPETAPPAGPMAVDPLAGSLDAALAPVTAP